MSYGPGMEGRGIVTAGQYKHGDLSLTVRKLRQSDGGIYRCLHRHEEPDQPDTIFLSIRGQCFVIRFMNTMTSNNADEAACNIEHICFFF